MLEGSESSGAGLAGPGSSYWSEAGSAGGERELHSRINNMAPSETTSISMFPSFGLIKDDFTLHVLIIILSVTKNNNNRVSCRCLSMHTTRSTGGILNFTISEKRSRSP